MTDKVQKIRAFLVGIADADGVSTILAKAIEKKILPYIDSLQEEPVSEELETFAKKESEEFAEREYEIGYIDRNALGKGYYWGCIDGAKWQKEKKPKK